MASSTVVCGVVGCGRAAGYGFGSAAGDAHARCGWHALTFRPVFRRAVAVALVVGTILAIINQADILISGHVTLLVVAKVGLTYLVPFSVSTYSALAANRLRS